ncbi:hypothetical protein [Pseudomonas sp. dw_358]|uniref:hypothetical protein n=1 Tax=Pseudomonas sp. dw_358 TaxID=2720083 RepID=UPI001BD5B4DF|nr:hypothetical protein [Pseudomonas sp. dw_358]
MKTVPSPEQFERLSQAAEIYTSDFSAYLDEIVRGFPEGKIPLSEAPRLIKLAVEGVEVFGKSALGEDGAACLEWLASEPAYAMAIKEVGFYMVEPGHWAGVFEKTISNWIRSGARTTALPYRLARNSNKFMAYVSRIGGAIHSYMTGIGHRAAIDGPATIAKLRQLLLEFEQLAGVDWMPAEAKKRLAYMVKTQAALRFLDSDILAQPVSKRNDVDLPARLLASELLRLNYSTYRNHHKRAVFHLMGLSIIERPLEMRTIERLAKIELDAERKHIAKEIADRKGLEYGDVLTTLKTNKSLTLPRENID